MNKTIVLGIGVAVLLVFAGVIAYFAFAGNSGSISQQSFGKENVFEGAITNKNISLSIGTVNGTGVYDHGCTMDPSTGLSNCHAGIRTTKYGLIDFNYEHNMGVKPCLGPGDQVIVNITSTNGAASVDRPVWNGTY